MIPREILRKKHSKVGQMIKYYKDTYPCVGCLCEPICQSKSVIDAYNDCVIFRNWHDGIFWFSAKNSQKYMQEIENNTNDIFRTKRNFERKFLQS